MAARVELRTHRGHSAPEMRTAAALLLISATCLACIQNDGSLWTPLPDFGQMDLDDERELGMEVDRSLQQSVRILYDPLVARFVDDLGQQIVQQIDPQPFLYRFRAIEAPSLNAFAVPGGYVYFHSGTLLAAGSVDEIAGVMGHEVAHVKAHHIARLQQQSKIPNLLTTVAGIAVAVATEHPGALIGAQATNVALQLRFTREFEAEADELGVVYTARAGYDPAGIERFFDRILEARGPDGAELPPYLYTHPQVEDRIDSIREHAEGLTPTKPHDPSMDDRFHEMQARLAVLLNTHRPALPVVEPIADPSVNDDLLAEASRALENGDAAAALARLEAPTDSARRDPRVQFRLAELLTEAGRTEDAIAAFERTIDLDPSRGLVYFRLGTAYKTLGNRPRAVYAYEQARLRSGPGGGVRERADWELRKLSFGVVAESGFADGSRQRERDTPAGNARVNLKIDDALWGWWGRISPPFVAHADELTVRWIAPDGSVASESRPVRVGRIFVASRFSPDADVRVRGRWTVESWLRNERVAHSEIDID